MMWNPITWLRGKPADRPAAGDHTKASLLPVMPEPKGVAEMVEKMRADYQVAFCEHILAANVQAVQVTVSSEDDRATMLAESMQDLWDRTSAKMLDVIAYGRVAFEKSWGLSGGLQTVTRLESLPFRRSRMKLNDGEFAGVELQTASGWDAFIERDNAWWLALGATVCEPHGKSRFHPAPYTVWRSRAGVQESRMTAVRKWALRGPIMRGPASDYDEQTGQTFDPFAEMEPAIKAHREGEMLYLPNTREGGPETEYKYTVVDPDMQGFDPGALNATMDRLDVELMRAFGIPEKTAMEGAGVGTYGAITQVFMILYAVVEGIVSEIVESYQKQVIDVAAAANGLPAGTVTATFVPLTSKPDAFVFEVIKLLLANPSFIESILSGGVDVRELLEQVGLPVTEQLESVMLAVAQRLQAAQATVPGMAAAPVEGAGAMVGLKRSEYNNAKKAAKELLQDLIDGTASEAYVREALIAWNFTPAMIDAMIAGTNDGTVDEPPDVEPVTMADVPIKAAVSLKVPTQEAILSDALGEFDELFGELVEALANSSYGVVADIRDEILSLRAQMATASRVLGMLTPWQAKINTYAGGAGGRSLSLADPTPKAVATSTGRTFVKHRDAAAGEVVVLIDPKKLDAAWKAGLESLYIGPDDPGINERRAKFAEFLETNQPIEASRVVLDKKTGRITFRDGRHRFAVLRDSGEKEVAVTVPRRLAEEFRQRFGASSVPSTTPVKVPQSIDTKRFPWIGDAFDFLSQKRVVKASDLKTFAKQDRTKVLTVPGVEDGATLRKIRAKLAEALKTGSDLPTFRKAIEKDVALTRAQTETLYRTNIKQGYVAGMDKALASPVVALEFPAVEYNATSDTRVRDNHWDLDGFVCLKSDPAYPVLKRALTDWNCRCSLTPLSMDEAQRKGIKTYSDLPSDVRAKYG